MSLRWLTSAFFILTLLFSGVVLSVLSAGCSLSAQESAASPHKYKNEHEHNHKDEHAHAIIKTDTLYPTHCIDAPHCTQCISALLPTLLTFSGQTKHGSYPPVNERKRSHTLSPEPYPPKNTHS